MSIDGCNRAYLALGSNVAAEMHLPAAVRRLADFGTVTAVSRVWESAAVGDPDQPNFLNAAVLLLTPLSARDLRLRAILSIEKQLGRVRDPANVNAARTIDIDLALFNRDVFQIEHRRIPDPEILQRPFLAVPLAELDPDYVLPGTKRTLGQIAAGFDPGTLTARPDVVLEASGGPFVVGGEKPSACRCS